MQAMDPAAADLYEEDGKDLYFYDFEPLPTLPEDEENVSLADILSLRDRGLSEQEAWAVCLECSLSMQSVAHAAIFQSLCITPDTLAFNTSGNVCFMEQLSDDPEGAFVPPEFDVTGNTFEAHIYSLGATLKAALEYVAEPALEPRLSQDLEALLSRMQAEDPGDRPDLESIIALCEEKLQLTSSCRVCRSLSAVGRRVLSIESFGALQGELLNPHACILVRAHIPVSQSPAGPQDGGQGHGRKELHGGRKNGISSFQAQPKCRLWPEQEPEHQLGGVPCAGRSADRGPGVPGSPGQPETSHPSQGPAEARPPPCPADPPDASGEAQTPGDDERIPEGAGQPESAAAEQVGARVLRMWCSCPAVASMQDGASPAWCCPQSAAPREGWRMLLEPVFWGAGLSAPLSSMDSRKILAHLRASICQVYQEEETISLQNAFSVVELKPSVAPAPEPSPAPAAPPAPAPHTTAAPTPAWTDTGGCLPETRAASPELGQHGPRSPACLPCQPPSLPKLPVPQAPAPGSHSRLPAAGPPKPTSGDPHRQGPVGQIPPGVTSGGLRPDALGPTAAHHGPRHPPKPPRSKATEHPSQEQEGPRATPAGERDDQSPDSVPERPRPADRRLCLPCVDASPLPGRMACPSLQEATRLIQEEFAFDGYLDNGLEALIMGEYIFALKDLTFATFCGAISEKFCDLYWDEKLLQNLFKVVNGQASPSPSTAEEAGSQLEGSRSPRSPSSKRPSLHRLGKEKPAVARTSSRAPCSPTSVSDVDSEALSRGNFEVGFRPQRSVKAERAQQPEAGEDRRPAGGASDAEAVTRPAKSKGVGPAVSPGPAGFQSCSPGWCSAFYEADCFGADVHNYMKDLGRQQADGALPDAQSPELEQQLMMEKRNYRKTLKFYQKLLQKEKRNKGSDVKTMLSKLKGQLEEMKSRVQFLSLVKKYLQVMYAERWGLEPCALPVIVNIAAAPCDTLDFSPLDESSSLIFYNVNKHPGGRQKARILQAGTPLGLMAYLYSSDAFLEGYVQQFLYTFRYFCTPHDFLHFLLDRINSTLTRYHAPQLHARQSFPLGQGGPPWAWFSHDEERGAQLWVGRLLSGSGWSFPWRLPRGNGLVLPPHKERPYTIAAALPKPCFLDDFYGPCAKTSEKGPYFLTEYSTHQLFSQLTLLQQELFQKCHPVHFLNSRALGVMDKSTAIPRASSSESLSAKTCSLFLPNYVQDKYLLQLLRNADDVSTWVAAEIVTSHTSKLQVNLLSKFLLIAKSCYEQRNFATAMQILSGLEHVAVRQSPAWRILPAKIAEVMEELKAVEVPALYSSQSLSPSWVSELGLRPQLSTGGRAPGSGALHWSAGVVSQVHAFQENPYTFSPDPKLQSYLKQRIAHFSGADISTLAADSRANFHQVSSEKHSRKIQDKLRRMKATFQ
uniref:Kinase non-catalytic C-lobe domain containing 1 n=1 Tax=Nomascus leucogenys TaxID=61853 RepID=G1QNC1_NOMLE